jgi:hypothetical protein
LGWLRQRLMQRDDQMQRGYARQLGAASLQVEMVFEAGDWVLMKQKRPGKMLSKALGPYRFVGYKNEHGLVAVIETVAGKKVECSVANLIPLRPGVRPLQQWRANIMSPSGE